ncbi:MAG: single-stranded DNA-binding protein [Cyanobacteria bacterium P01_F01_bin.150]
MNNVILMAPAATAGQLRYANDGQTTVGQVFVNCPDGRDSYVGLAVSCYGKTAETLAAIQPGQLLLVEQGELCVYGKERGYGFEVVARKLSVLAPHSQLIEVFKAQITGKLGRDTDLRYYESGSCKTENSVALYAGKDKPPYWINVELWGKQAELMAQYNSKGATVSIAGRINIQQWKDKATGQDRFKLVVVAEKFNPFAGSRGHSEPSDRQFHQNTQQAQPVTPVYEPMTNQVAPTQAAFEEIPF